MDINDPVPLQSLHSPADAPSEPVYRAVDWLLFIVTVIGAIIVYVSLFNQLLVGFIVGESICGSVWIGGMLYKRARTRREKLKSGE